MNPGGDTIVEPLVSVIVPVYGEIERLHLLRQALLSVLNQTYKTIEVIVVDDGSPAAFTQMASCCLNQIDGLHAKLLPLSTNCGVSVARNAGIDAATGKYVSFLDWDDLYLPDFITKCVTVMEASHTVEVVLSPSWFSTEHHGQTGVRTDSIPSNINYCSFSEYCIYMLEHNFPTAMGTAIVCKRDLFFKNPQLRYDEHLSKLTAEDVLFGFKLLLHDVRPWFLDTPLVVHRSWKGLTSRAMRADKDLDELAVDNYIAEEATSILIDRATCGKPEVRDELLRQKVRRQRLFQVKNAARSQDVILLARLAGFDIRLLCNALRYFARQSKWFRLITAVFEDFQTVRLERDSAGSRSISDLMLQLQKLESRVCTQDSSR